GVDRFRNGDDAILEMPAKDNLRRHLSMSPTDAGDDGIRERPGRGLVDPEAERRDFDAIVQGERRPDHLVELAYCSSLMCTNHSTGPLPDGFDPARVISILKPFLQCAVKPVPFDRERWERDTLMLQLALGLLRKERAGIAELCRNIGPEEAINLATAMGVAAD